MASPRDRMRANGTIAWQAMFRDEVGKQRAFTFETKTERDQFLENIDNFGIEDALEIQAELEEDSGTAPSLAAYAKSDIEDRPKVGEYMRERYLKEIDRDWGRLGRMPINQVTQKMVQKWVNSLSAKGNSPATVAKKHGLMASVFNVAEYDDGLDMGRNPTKRTRLPKVEDTEEAAFDHDEFPTFLQYVPEYWRDFVIVSVALATRFSETTALDVASWKPTQGPSGVMRVSKAWKAKGTSGQYFLGTTKTVKGKRDIPVSPMVAEILSRHAKGKRKGDLLFTNPKGQRIDNDSFNKFVWAPAMRLANGQPWLNRDGKPAKPSGKSPFRGIDPAKEPLGKWVKVHGLRHTGGTWMTEATGDLHLVQYFMGHESITTTMNRYNHILPKRAALLAAGMGASMNAAISEFVPVEALKDVQLIAA